jgi:hypothetical protein
VKHDSKGLLAKMQFFAIAPHGALRGVNFNISKTKKLFGGGVHEKPKLKKGDFGRFRFLLVTLPVFTGKLASRRQGQFFNLDKSQIRSAHGGGIVADTKAESRGLGTRAARLHQRRQPRTVSYTRAGGEWVSRPSWVRALQQAGHFADK